MLFICFKKHKDKNHFSSNSIAVLMLTYASSYRINTLLFTCLSALSLFVLNTQNSLCFSYIWHTVNQLSFCVLAYEPFASWVHHDEVSIVYLSPTL